MAKRFRFRLETLLRIRRHHEDLARQQVARRLGEVAEADRRIARLQEQIAEHVRALRAGPMVGPLDVAALTRSRFWLTHLRHGMWQTAGQRRELSGQLDADRTALQEAHRQTRVIESLRERRKRQYDYEVARTERIENDEIGLNQFVFGTDRTVPASDTTAG